MNVLKKNGIYLLLFVILAIFSTSQHDFDSQFQRPIQGDLKAYYAYLPAAFIYQDKTYSFVDKIEQRYYPSDGSAFKDFTNKQPNGTVVNKTFPGLAFAYAPFFAGAALFAKLFDYDVDGYSQPFQYAIVFAHWVYLILALFLLQRASSYFECKKWWFWIVSLAFIFGTNIHYYVVYDFSVSHIFNFFLASAFILSVLNWIVQTKLKFLGFAMLILTFSLVVRPTNALFFFFIPLLALFVNKDLRKVISATNFKKKQNLFFILGVIMILFIPLIIWKVQTDYWLVYSYKDEGFDFFNPQVVKFLFSFEKGWLTWSPVIAVSLIYIIILNRNNWKRLISLLLPLFVTVYVFSSWWCWTYGTGFGQRPMIEFLPFIMIVLFSIELKWQKVFGFLAIPLVILSMIQAYQTFNGILPSAEVTRKVYASNFLRMKTLAPSVRIDESNELLKQSFIKLNETLGEGVHYSKTAELTCENAETLVATVKVGAEYKNENIRVVVANQGKFYNAVFVGGVTYSEPRSLSYKFDVSAFDNKDFVCYVWNSDTKEKAEVVSISLKAYHKQQ